MFLGKNVFAEKFRVVASVSAGFLFALFVLSLFPLTNNAEKVDAAPTPSTTTLSMTTPSVGLSLAINDINGTFASETSNFTVTTNNYTGYTLSIRAKEDNANNSKLINGSHVLNSISAATADDTGFGIGDWGYKPSKLDSVVNTDYLPSPTYTGSTLDVTNAANSTANTYSIALAAKADYAIANGTYSNTFVLSAVGNPVNYTITYDKNTTDTVTNMPSTQIGTLSTTDITLSSNTPSRQYYIFLGWCTAEVTSSTCSGTTYAPGDIVPTSMQTSNIFNLRAIWSPVNYAISYTLNSGSASGNPSTYNYETASFTLNNPTRSGYTFAGWTGTGIATISRSVTVPQGSTGDRNYTANWCPNEKLFTYSGAVEPYTISQYCSGSYQLEAWGAEGGTGTIGTYQGIGGKGGYSEGTLSLQANTQLYIAVGGKGSSVTATSTTQVSVAGGFNGGGTGNFKKTSYVSNICGGSGGGATSIGYVSGTIGNGITADTANQVLVIAGGGGGGVCFFRSDTSSSKWIQANGGHGGGSTFQCNINTGVNCYSNSGAQGLTIAGRQSLAYSPNPSYSVSTSAYRPGVTGGGGGISSNLLITSGHMASASSGGLGLNNITDGTMQSGIREGDGQAKITLKSLSN